MGLPKSVKDHFLPSSSSPKTPKSPLETDQNVANWMLYWSSRVEAEPPK